MSSIYPKRQLDEVIEIISGGTPSTNNSDYWGGDIPWLSVADFNTGYRWVSTAEKRITELGLRNSPSRLLNKGDIIISARGTVGALAQLAVPMAFNQSCYGIKGIEGTSDTNFLFYALRLAVSDLQHIAHGAVFSTITKDTFSKIFIPFPDLPDQRRIASILGNLDDQIENNRKLAKTLEAMAQAIFQSWFVDFDPVRAKMAGESRESICQRLKITPEILDLFPDRLVDSELGEIPEGWEVGQLGDIVGLQNGYAFKSKDWQSCGVPVVKIGSVQPGFVDLSHASFVSVDVANQLGDYRLHPADLVIGMTGYVGHVGMIPISPVYPLLNQRVGRFVLSDRGTKKLPFLYCLATQQEFKKLVVSKSHGTAQANVSSGAILSIKIIKPNDMVRSTFDRACSELFDKLLSIYSLTAKLSDLVGSLLPKLVSGEISVAQWEELIQAAIKVSV